MGLKYSPELVFFFNKTYNPKCLPYYMNRKKKCLEQINKKKGLPSCVTVQLVFAVHFTVNNSKNIF